MPRPLLIILNTFIVDLIYFYAYFPYGSVRRNIRKPTFKMTGSVIQRASRTPAFVGPTLAAAGGDNFLRLIAASESRVAEVEDSGAGFAGVVTVGSGALHWQDVKYDVMA